MSPRNTLTEEPRPIGDAVDLERLDYQPAATDERRKTRMLVLAAVVGVVLLAIVYFVFIRERKPAAAGENVAETASQPAAPVPISTVAASVHEVPAYLDATGSLEPYERTDVASQVAGQVVATPVDEGAFVRRGQVLARLDDRDARLRVQQAEAAVTQAEAAVRQQRANLGLEGGEQLNPANVAEVESARAQMVLAETNERRYRSLLETGDVSQAQYDQYKAQADTARKAYEAALAKAKSGGAGIAVQQGALEAARAQLAMAKKTLADTVIAAPLSGYVESRPVAVGEWVTSTSKIATIVQNDTLKLNMHVAEADADRVRVGQPVRLAVDTYPAREFGGTVSAIVPALDPNSRALTAIVQVPNPNGALKPGMFASARVIEPTHEKNGIFIPVDAVQRNSAGTAVVYVIADNRAQARVVQVGTEADGQLQIVSGVQAGEQVATAGVDQLTDGTPVIVNGQ